MIPPVADHSREEAAFGSLVPVRRDSIVPSHGREATLQVVDHWLVISYLE
jgi:hypothetical protein